MSDGLTSPRVPYARGDQPSREQTGTNCVGSETGDLSGSGARAVASRGPVVRDTPAFRAAWGGGQTVAQMAEMFGVRPKSLRAAARRFDYPQRNRDRVCMTDFAGALPDMWRSGAPLSDMEAAFNCSADAVLWLAAHLGLPERAELVAARRRMKLRSEVTEEVSAAACRAMWLTLLGHEWAALCERDGFRTNRHRENVATLVAKRRRAADLAEAWLRSRDCAEICSLIGVDHGALCRAVDRRCAGQAVAA